MFFPFTLNGDVSESRAVTEPAGKAEGQSLRFYWRRIQRHPAFVQAKEPVTVARRSIPAVWRLATQRFRALPSVVIVGAQKAGTTQLYASMVKHPQVLGGWKKEVSYFSKHLHRSVEWYRSQFPLERRVARQNGVVIEASPSYLPTPSALRGMQSVIPDARAIVLLRDPVARAFSHYQHYKTRHLDSRSFEQAVEEELRQNAFPPECGVALRQDAARMWGYVSRGYYALQIELLLQLYSRDRVLVIDSSDLFRSTGVLCKRVFSFLELEEFDVRSNKVYNRGYYKERIEPRTAERLREHYRSYDKLLQQILGRKFSWMSDYAALEA